MLSQLQQNGVGLGFPSWGLHPGMEGDAISTRESTRGPMWDCRAAAIMRP